MARDIDEVLKQIEQLRRSLEEIVKEKRIGDPEVVIASQMFDVVLNEYYRLLRKKQEKE